MAPEAFVPSPVFSAAFCQGQIRYPHSAQYAWGILARYFGDGWKQESGTWGTGKRNLWTVGHRPFS